MDKIRGTDLTRKLLCDLERCYFNESFFNLYRVGNFYCDGKRCKTAEQILKGYDRINDEYNKTKFDFRSIEAKKRKLFYQRHRFTEEINFDSNGRQTRIPTRETTEMKAKEIEQSDLGTDVAGKEPVE